MLEKEHQELPSVLWRLVHVMAIGVAYRSLQTGTGNESSYVYSASVYKALGHSLAYSLPWEVTRKYSFLVLAAISYQLGDFKQRHLLSNRTGVQKSEVLKGSVGFSGAADPPKALGENPLLASSNSLAVSIPWHVVAGSPSALSSHHPLFCVWVSKLPPLLSCDCI